MKFGKRQPKQPKDADAGAPAVATVAADSEPVAEPMTLPDAPAAAAPVAEPVPPIEPPPAVAPEPPPPEEPVVEGEAFELFTDDPPAADSVAPPSFAVHQHQPPPAPESMPFPVAEQPVAVVTPEQAAVPVTPLGDAGEAFASGHAAGPGPGPGPGPSWQEPVMELANERPELVVGAAFAGGLVAALILRRLGN